MCHDLVNPSRRVLRASFTAILAVVCAGLSACHSHTPVALATAATQPLPTAGEAQPLAMEPAAPVDDRPITPRETVGAAATE